ncbi:hypothetical protein [Bradyrhizobium sp. Tv2a-2]|uniref:hypothetical protein n=1 Tax=Bradyrhizobium sp. Tv2a-2 TaxID=113395 RepID=UPI000428823A|nr:hypothetical protein [Bradyrhizobium sp. Tv2a-2]
MGEVVKFRRARFAGFIPDDLGDRPRKHNPHSPMHTAPLLRPGRDAGSIGLIDFAKSGAPPVPDLAEPTFREIPTIVDDEAYQRLIARRWGDAEPQDCA